MAGKARPKVLIKGQPVGPIAALTLDQVLGEHHSFSVTCPITERQGALERFVNDFVGQAITIQLLAGLDEGRGELSFEGVVTKVHIAKSEAALEELVIEGYSPTYRLDGGPRYRSFTGKPLAEIVKTVANDFPHLATDIDPRHTAPIPYVTQYGESAHAFLNRLLATYGEWSYYDGTGAVYGRPPEGEVTELVFGHDLIGLNFAAKITPAEFKAIACAYLGDTHFDSRGARASVPGIDDRTRELLGAASEVFSHEPVLVESLGAPDQRTLAMYARRRRAAVVAQLLQLAGTSTRLDLELGQVIKVRALASALRVDNGDAGADYGNFRITSLQHSCNANGDYHNVFKACPSALEMPPTAVDVAEAPRAARQLAVVTENDDPEQLGRVRVQFPWQRPDAEHTPWLRVETAGAGRGHGIYFVPEIGDQVYVGFEYDNPDRPVVTGSAYHGGVKPAGAHDPDNNTKRIRTRSGNEVVFSDKDGEESVTVANGTNVITLSLKDNHAIDIASAGDITLSGENVNIIARKALTLTAGEDATYESGQKTTVTAGTGYTVDGGPSAAVLAQDVNVEAQVGLVAQGGATADVKAPNATVKGDALVTVEAPMVKLN